MALVCKVKGRDYYLYRVAKAAKAFFRKAFRLHGQSKKVCIDKSGSHKSALISFNAKDEDKASEIVIYKSKYLNNIVEQNHRFVKRLPPKDAVQGLLFCLGNSGRH